MPNCSVLICQAFGVIFVKKLYHLSIIATTILCKAVIAAPAAPSLMAPYNYQTNISTSGYNMQWYATGYKSTYRIVISQNANFSGFTDNLGSSSCDGTCFTTTTTATSYWKNFTCGGHTYYWKIRANDATGASAWSSARQFTTAGTVDTCPAVSAYGQSIWNEANRAYVAGERWTYKGSALTDSSWTYCARFVRLVHNIYASTYSTAQQMCQNYANKGKLKTTGTPPAGAAICYKPMTSGSYNNGGAGHIGIANGAGTELGVLSRSLGVYPRTSLTNVSGYYWGWISADDFKNYY